MEDEYKEFLKGLRDYQNSRFKSGLSIILSVIAMVLNLVLILITPKILWGVTSISLMLWMIYCLWIHQRDGEQYSEWAYRKYGKKVFEYAKRAEEDELC